MDAFLRRVIAIREKEMEEARLREDVKECLHCGKVLRSHNRDEVCTECHQIKTEKITDEIRVRILELAAEGKSVVRISKRLSVRWAAVNAVIKEGRK